MPAGSQQAVILVNRRLDTCKSLGNFVATFDFNSHLSGFFSDHHMVFKKHRCVLRDGFEFFSQSGKGRAVNGVRMAHRQNIGMRLVHRRMQHKAGPIDSMLALDHLTVMVDQNQVRNLDLRKMHGHRVGPVQRWTLWVAHRQVAGKAVVKTLQSESPASGDQALLAVLPLFGMAGKHRYFWKLEAHLLGLINRDTFDAVQHESPVCVKKMQP